MTSASADDYPRERLDSDCHLTIFYQNLCGVLKKKDDLCVYFGDLETNVDYICLCEHFLTSKNVSTFNLQDFKLAAYNTRKTKKRGGSLILAKQDIVTVELGFCKELYKMDSFEVCGVRDVINNLNICCVYRTPDDKNFVDFLTRLEQLLEHFFSKKCIILGDFNVNFLKDSKKKGDVLSLLSCFNFRHLIKDITFVRNDSESCIDNIITNVPETEFFRCFTDHNMLGDGHAALVCSLIVDDNIGVAGMEEVLIVRQRRYTKTNKDYFRDNLLNSDLENCHINSFLSKFQTIFKKSFKLKSQKVRLNKKGKINWISRGIKDR